MKNLISKYKELNGMVKFIFWMLCISTLCSWAFAVFTYTGWHIPSDDEIFYTQGKVKTVEVGYSQYKGASGTVKHIELYTDDGRVVYFVCSYTAYYYTQYSGCDGRRILNDL